MFKVQSSKFKLCALCATLSTGLLHYVRNETERYAKVAARTLVRRRHMQKNNVIASECKRCAANKLPLVPNRRFSSDRAKIKTTKMVVYISFARA